MRSFGEAHRHASISSGMNAWDVVVIVFIDSAGEATTAYQRPAFRLCPTSRSWPPGATLEPDFGYFQVAKNLSILLMALLEAERPPTRPRDARLMRGMTSGGGWAVSPNHIYQIQMFHCVV